jgi:predicted SAM-dependent methyltransferase
MHPEVLEYVHEQALVNGPFGSVLEIGGRDVNGGVRDCFPGAFYWAVDITDGPGVNEVCDFGTRVKASTEMWDCIVCTEVLEHAANADQIIANAHAHLEDQGVLIMTMANEKRQPHSAYDPSPQPGVIAPPRPDEYYRGVTLAMLCEWMRAAGFEAFSTDQLGADLRVTAWKGVQRTPAELAANEAELAWMMEQQP